MSFWIIANILSFVTACFTAASSLTKDPRRAYAFQTAQCIVYALASYFFGMYASIIMMLINALRNYLFASGRLTLKWTLVLSALTLAFGLTVSGHTFPEYLSVFLTLGYTISSFLLTGAKTAKINLIADLALWVVYDIMIVDISSFAIDIICTVFAVITLFRIIKSERQQPKSK